MALFDSIPPPPVGEIQRMFLDQTRVTLQAAIDLCKDVAQQYQREGQGAAAAGAWKCCYRLELAKGHVMKPTEEVQDAEDSAGISGAPGGDGDQ